jgi:hypothetical protein
MVSELAAIPGVPETLPDQAGKRTIVWSNDCHAYPMALNAEEQDEPMDDWRTNAFTGTYRYRNWRACLDDSMLTSKYLGLRTDEISATVGYDFGHVTVGGGVRSRRDYTGQSMQNTWHKVWHDLPLHLDQDAHGEDAIIYALADLPALQCTRQIRLQPIASALIASDGEHAADAGALFVINGDRYSIFAGARYQFRDGADSDLVRKIEKHERGVAIQYGFARHHGFSFSVIAVSDKSWSGSLGWSF